MYIYIYIPLSLSIYKDICHCSSRTSGAESETPRRASRDNVNCCASLSLVGVCVCVRVCVCEYLEWGR